MKEQLRRPGGICLEKETSIVRPAGFAAIAFAHPLGYVNTLVETLLLPFSAFGAGPMVRHLRGMVTRVSLTAGRNLCSELGKAHRNLGQGPKRRAAQKQQAVLPLKPDGPRHETTRVRGGHGAGRDRPPGGTVELGNMLRMVLMEGHF